MMMKGILLLIVVAAFAPSTAGAATSHGIVVGRQHGMLLVASPAGVVTAVRAHASIGARLSGSSVVGHATRARLHGVVVKRIGSTMILSSNRHLLAVQLGRTTAAAAPTAPATGAVVDATVGVRPNGELEEQDEDEVGQVNGAIAVQATVTAVGAGTVTLAVNGQTFTVGLPAGLTLPASVVGQTVTLNVAVGDDQGDDDQGDDDHGGDRHGDDHGGDRHGGDDHGGDRHGGDDD